MVGPCGVATVCSSSSRAKPYIINPKQKLVVVHEGVKSSQGTRSTHELTVSPLLCVKSSTACPQGTNVTRVYVKREASCLSNKPLRNTPHAGNS
jgi:hypothetical protein